MLALEIQDIDAMIIRLIVQVDTIDRIFPISVGNTFSNTLNNYVHLGQNLVLTDVLNTVQSEPT